MCSTRGDLVVAIRNHYLCPIGWEKDEAVYD